jgi:SAM-dependent methyltransferase
MEFSDLARLASGHVEARIIQAAVQLGIFDAIGNDALEAGTVAKSLNLESRATDLMLNALTALGLLCKRTERFCLTDVSLKYLKHGTPEYLGGMIGFDASLWACWEQLPDAVRNGLPVRPANMYQDDPTETETFVRAMDSLVKARGDAEVMGKAFDWNNATELLDVGSGPATYPIALCKSFPALRATIFDLTGTLKFTQSYVREAGLEDQIRLIPGDYRKDTIPGSYDIVFLSNIIHAEGESDNESLVCKLAAVLNPGGRFVIKDHILDESHAHPSEGAIFSLLMLLTTAAGRCYSFREIRGWMERAGLRNAHQIALPPPLTSSLVIATKI